jgi:hypothetical protein
MLRPVRMHFSKFTGHLSFFPDTFGIQFIIYSMSLFGTPFQVKGLVSPMGKCLTIHLSLCGPGLSSTNTRQSPSMSLITELILSQKFRIHWGDACESGVGHTSLVIVFGSKRSRSISDDQAVALNSAGRPPEANDGRRLPSSNFSEHGRSGR